MKISWKFVLNQFNFYLYIIYNINRINYNISILVLHVAHFVKTPSDESVHSHTKHDTFIHAKNKRFQHNTINQRRTCILFFFQYERCKRKESSVLFPNEIRTSAMRNKRKERKSDIHDFHSQRPFMSALPYKYNTE